MNKENKFKITSNDYMDLIIRYNNNLNLLKPYENYTIQIMNEANAVIYLPVTEISTFNLMELGYYSIPNYYALCDEQSLEASGVQKLRRIPAINLTGKGIVIGIIDTGIDYTNPAFINEDGSTKIISIWDQTIQGDENPIAVNPTYYGTEYTAAQINQALKSPTPFDIVPSTDENGHGTMMAAIAAGSEDKANHFSGVAPNAELMIVKLKQAKNNLKDLYFIQKELNCYQENDIMWGLQYILYTARSLERPLSICFGIGTSLGAHNDYGLLNTLVALAADTPRVVLSVPTGNEGSLNRHFFSEITSESGAIGVELNIGEGEFGFTMELWGNPPMIYTMNISSPSGEKFTVYAYRLTETQIVRFIFDPTVIYINYVLIEQISGQQVIILRFDKPSSGIWRFDIFGKGYSKGAFHMWLPVSDLISKNTYFLKGDPNTTITSPGNSSIAITVTAYNPENGTLYANAGRGFSTTNIINPDLAAPGVNIIAPTLNHRYARVTGTSVAAAHTAGITALLLEWGVVNNNYPNVDTLSLKKFLMRGAKRESKLSYPNPDWGYGIIDVFNTFDVLRSIVW